MVYRMVWIWNCNGINSIKMDYKWFIMVSVMDIKYPWWIQQMIHGMKMELSHLKTGLLMELWWNWKGINGAVMVSIMDYCWQIMVHKMDKLVSKMVQAMVHTITEKVLTSNTWVHWLKEWNYNLFLVWAPIMEHSIYSISWYVMECSILVPLF